jgi:PAS domain S-box-containing protein
MTLGKPDGPIALGTGPSDGTLGALIATTDWCGSPLGALADWPVSLRATLAFMLPAQAQIVLFWGPEYLAFYNDAYAPTIGDKHPRALGRPAAEFWSELWDDLEPLLRSVRETGQTVVAKDRPFYIERRGYGEEVYFDISYSAIRENDGTVVGVLCIVSETTERVRTQKQSEAALQQMAELFDQTPGFMAVLAGPAHVFELANAAYQRLIGDRSIIGKPVREALPEIASQGFPDLLDRVYESGKAHHGRAVKVALSRSPGATDERYLDFIYQPIRDAAGRTTGIFVQGSDVTDQHAAIEAKRQGEERLRLATEGGAVGTWDYDPASGTLRWDTQCKALFGLPPDAEVSYQGSFVAGLHPDDREMAQKAVEAALSEDGPGVYDVEYRTIGLTDGVERSVAARGRGVFENGKAVRFVGTVVDISRAKQAERALAELNRSLANQVEERTRERDRIWQVSEDLLGVAAFDGTWRSVSPAWTRVLGWQPEQIIGRSSEWLEHPDDVARTRAEIARLADGQTTLSFENRFLAKDGSYRTLSWRAVPVEDEIYCVARDVTEARKAAEALQDAEARLRQAQKMETVGQLSGGIAHDFNNLLQVVAGNLETVQRNLPPDAPRLRRATENAMTGAKRAATLTQRLLAFSRRQPLSPTRIDPNRLVSGMSELLHRTLGETIAVETVLMSGIWTIEVDTNQLESAILNLAVNARDAMPQGGKLTIETANALLDRDYVAQHSDVLAGQYVVICVSDTGEGIAKDVLARVFEPFFTTKDPGKGTGLGLSMVYGFVKQSGGHVKIYSETGEGTTVKIYLPRVLARAEEAEAEVQAPPPERARNETILVCEDDADVRAYSVEVLTELGYHVVEAEDGRAALRILERYAGRIDLLFTDVVLPGGMTGADLAREARSRWPNLRVMFTTGYARNAIVHHGRLDAGVELVTKPFTYADLAARVRDVLDK